MAQILVLQCFIINIVHLVAEMHHLVEEYTFNGLWRLVSKFHFLVALGPEYGVTKSFMRRFFSSATAISSGSDVHAHMCCLWEFTCTKELSGRWWRRHSTSHALLAQERSGNIL